MVVDKYNRTIDYARISVTDRCNLRCKYCIPSDCNYEHHDIMSNDDILKICKSLANNNIKKIKITGGEPLVRNDIVKLINDIKNIKNIEQVTITTNGVLLSKYIDDLLRVNIDGINISIDALDRELFKDITGFDKIDEILNSIDIACKKGFKNIKINCVLIKDLNESEYEKIARLAKDRDICVRFIEMMPIGLGKEYNTVLADDVKRLLEKKFGKFTVDTNKYGNGPANYFKVENFKGRIGFIGAISHKFCENCNRVRVTSQGKLKTCLHFNSGTNLLEYVNSKELDDVVKNAIYNKYEEHQFEKINDDLDYELKLMAQIGG